MTPRPASYRWDSDVTDEPRLTVFKGHRDTYGSCNVAHCHYGYKVIVLRIPGHPHEHEVRFCLKHIKELKRRLAYLP